jgi:alpha-1,6-mannosyltransferase
MCDHACVLARGQLTRLRFVGLAGAAALAVGGYSVGALPGRASADALPSLGQAPGTIACVVGLIALTGAWWQIGRVTHAPGGPELTGRWMLVTAALWALPLVLAPPLGSRDVYAYACQGATLYAGLNPHGTGAADLPCPWLDSVPPIWRDAASPYGPLFSLMSAGAVALSDGRIAVVVGLFRLLALAGVGLAAWYGRRLARECGVSAGRAAWLGLATPLVALHAVTGAHNDALVTGLVIASIAATLGTSSMLRRGAYAGVVLGLAVAVKVTALVAAPFLPLVLVAATGAQGAVTWRRLARAGGILVATTVLTYGVLAITSGLGLGFLRGLGRTGELAQWTSVPTALGMSVGYLLRAAGFESGYDNAVAVARVAGLAALVGVVAAVWWRAWRAPLERVRHAIAGAAIAFAALALLGPVSYPWYALTPLALFSVSTVDERVRAWLGAAAGILAFLILPNGAGLAVRTKLPGAVVVTATIAVTVAAMAAHHRRRDLLARPTTQASSTRARTRTRDPRSGR